MNSLLVVADDFTGALDTGVQFSRKGVPALVLTKEQALFERSGMSDVDVLVVDIESRHIPPGEAYKIVRDITADAAAHGVRYFYKKTDSALRGNVGAELAGMLDASEETCLTFVPAFPKSNRVTRDGIQYIDGVEVANSVFSKDPFEPVRYSAVSDVISLQTDIPTENIPKWAYERAALKPDKRTLRILDAESMEDIERLGAQLKLGGNLRLLAGCAGFAEILPDLLDLSEREMAWRKNTDNILIVSGSVNPITIDQLLYGDELGISAFTLSPLQKLDAGYIESHDCETFVRDIAEILGKRGQAIIRTVGKLDEVAVTESLARKSGIPESEISRRVAENIGAITLRILNSAHVGNLVVFGGDTLHSILSKMRCEGVLPVFEISPGLVAARILSPDHDCVVITKSGGLGGHDVLGSIEAFVWRE
ncbi:MAG: four-carbon acid sugar kinase family protein [Synergistaceae bacterium]|jgi:uncharacterized protein YgbK (DUF1537 family)|nr:four-carbon acid sugar kinase family protein [Synergistaceae bacterium]